MAVSRTMTTPCRTSVCSVHTGNPYYCSTQARLCTKSSSVLEFRSRDRNTKACSVMSMCKKPLQPLLLHGSLIPSRAWDPCNSATGTSSFADMMGSFSLSHACLSANNVVSALPEDSDEPELENDQHLKNLFNFLDWASKTSWYLWEIFSQNFFFWHLLGRYLIQLARDVFTNNPWLLPETGSFKWFKWILNICVHGLFYAGCLVGFNCFDWLSFLKQRSASSGWIVNLCYNLTVAAMVGGLLNHRTNNYALELVLSCATALGIISSMGLAIHLHAYESVSETDSSKLDNFMNNLNGKRAKKEIKVADLKEHKYLRSFVYVLEIYFLVFFIFCITGVIDIINGRPKWLLSLANYQVSSPALQFVRSIVSLLPYPFLTAAIGGFVDWLMDLFVAYLYPNTAEPLPNSMFKAKGVRNGMLIIVLHLVSNARYVSFQVGHWLTSRTSTGSRLPGSLSVGCLLFFAAGLFNLCLLLVVAVPILFCLGFNPDGVGDKALSSDDVNLEDESK